MKSMIKFCAVVLLVFIGCKNEKAANNLKQEGKHKILSFDSFGAKITKDAALNEDEMFMKFSAMKVGDTAIVKFASKIKEVCSKKGCWMKLPLGDSSETMVRFKDYGFFMPLDSKGREVILEGMAFVQETSIKELKHYAEDAEKAKEEIAKIIAPKKEFIFEANGVLVKK
jgi:hypothetical protein